MKPIIFYFPPFDNPADLNDHLARASWYLSSLEPERIYLPVIGQLKENFSFHVPPHLDKQADKIYRRLTDRIRLIDAGNEEEHVKCFEESLLVMQWKMDSYPSLSWKQRVNEAIERKEKQLWKVDHNRVRYAGSFYIKAGFERGNFSHMEEEIDLCREKFNKMTAEIGTVERSFLFLTGPMAALYREFDFRDGLSIICNSTIFDEELLTYIKPRIMTFGDPIFHFGISQYAATFRERLVEVLKRHKFHICIPFNYYRLFTYHFPQFKDITIGIPFDYKKPINFDLNQDFYLNPYKNILTMLMLPLAATFSKEIHMIGADGRKKSESEYFWSFNPRTQINDKMSNIREAHPAFFDIDYNEYYEEHIDTLADFLVRGEEAGKTFHMMTPSYIPCLRRRYTYRNRDYEKSHYPLVSIIMPCHNNGDTIEASVDSVLIQDYPNWELVIVDEASGGDTQEVLRKIEKKDQRIKIIHKEQKNAAAARNKGIAAAGGKYIAFLDSDDIYYPHSLRPRMEALILNDYQAVFGTTQLLDENLVDLNNCIKLRKDFITFLDLSSGIFHISSLIIKKELLLGSNSFDEGESFYAVEDMDLLQRLARKGVVFYNLRNAETGYRQNPGGAVFRDYTGHAQRVKMIWDLIYGEDTRVRDPRPEYKSGLGHAEKLYQQMKRQFQVLLWTILDGDIDKAEEIAGELPAALTFHLTEQELLALLKDTIIRFYRCGKQEWRKYYLKHKEDMEQILGDKRLLVLSHGPGFFTALRSIGGIVIKSEMEHLSSETLIKRIQAREKIIENREEEIKELKKKLHKRNRMIANRDGGIKRLNEQLVKKEVMIKNRDRGIADLKERLARKNRLRSLLLDISPVRKVYNLLKRIKGRLIKKS